MIPAESGKKRCNCVLSAVFLAVVFLLFATCLDSRRFIRIADWQTGEVYIEHPVSPGDELFFGWIHSLDKFPWNEYFTIDENFKLILDTVSFTEFGAGVPQDMGNDTFIKDGVIYMSGINQKFTELVWINSPTATQEIRIAGEFVTRGAELPHNRRLVLTVERRNFFGKKR